MPRTTCRSSGTTSRSSRRTCTYAGPGGWRLRCLIAGWRPPTEQRQQRDGEDTRLLHVAVDSSVIDPESRLLSRPPELHGSGSRIGPATGAGFTRHEKAYMPPGSGVADDSARLPHLYDSNAECTGGQRSIQTLYVWEPPLRCFGQAAENHSLKVRRYARPTSR